MSGRSHDIVKKDLHIGEDESNCDVNRPGSAHATNGYAAAGEIKNKHKVAAYAGAGYGHASAEWSIFDAEANGPNASAGVEVSQEKFRAIAKAEVASASASVGALSGTVGLAADTGVEVSKSGVELKVLGTGISVGRRTGISFFGSGVEIDFGKLF